MMTLVGAPATFGCRMLTPLPEIKVRAVAPGVPQVAAVNEPVVSLRTWRLPRLTPEEVRPSCEHSPAPVPYGLLNGSDVQLLPTWPLPTKTIGLFSLNPMFEATAKPPMTKIRALATIT